MSGGRIAISGFDYQAIVILDQLFDHFDQHGASARARPEGEDDLDLTWREGGRDHRLHIQVKKPRETDKGVAKPRPWRLSEVADELLPNTLRQLAATSSGQVWILGNVVEPDVRRLIDAGRSAAAQAPGPYWSAVHLLARASVVDRLPAPARRALPRWRFANPSSIARDARDALVSGYGQVLKTAGADAAILQDYADRVSCIDQDLPDVLSRVTISDSHGSEAEVGQRFKDRLQREYGLPPDVAEHNLFGNFRSFINDVAKRPGLQIDRPAFEIQLRSAWPQMSAATEAPAAPADGIVRSDLVNTLVRAGGSPVTEVIGISGSGKTTLAAQAAAALTTVDPGRLPIYVRVRADAAFRDVIAGVAFHLLRRGTPDLFGLAVESRSADETKIARLAGLCSGLSQPIHLLLDLVDGAGNAQFGRDLGRFVRALTPGSCRLAIFSQESALGALSMVEIESAGVLSVNMRGFDWEEFAQLAARHHVSADRAALYEIFQRVTVGRATGLLAQLAEALVRQPTLAAMHAIANRPPEDMVSAAERARFDQLPLGVRSAAEHLVCFALPFSLRDAETIFPNQNIGAAVKALLHLGLLRAGAEGRLEMHETVRAGLESGIAVAVRQAAHDALAVWYSGRGEIAEQVFHLEKAGDQAEAHRIGREAFLRGEAWRSLSSYVTGRRLVTAEEVILAAAPPQTIDDFYYLRPVLAELGSGESAECLMQLLEQQTARYFDDHAWARPIVETILVLSPERLHALLIFTVSRAINTEQRRQGLAWLSIGARSRRRVLTSETVAFAKSQPADVQNLLLSILLFDGGREGLTLAFEIYGRTTNEEVRRDARWSGATLTPETREDVAEILAALPTIATPPMARSLGFRGLEPLLWAARHKLRPFCLEIIKAEDGDVGIKSAAWRVLIFAGHQGLETLVDPLDPGSIPIDLVLLGPTLAPSAYTPARYESVLLNPSAAAGQRSVALSVLFALNADFGALRDRLANIAGDPLCPLWDRLFVALFITRPFPAGTAILRAELTTPSTPPLPVTFLVASLAAIGEVEWPGVTELFLGGVQHSDLSVRRTSAHALGRRRASHAATELEGQFAIESDSEVAVLLAQALAASAPASAAVLAAGGASADLDLWRCVIAMRTRDESFAPQLVRLAIDPAVQWAVRRAAIWAAGRLPYDAALKAIAPVVLAEQSPLTLDRGENFQLHASVSDLLNNGVSDFLTSGEANFVGFIASVLEQRWGDLLPRDDLPAPVDAARWLFTNLMRAPSPAGIQTLVDAVHRPLLHAAVVRAMRHCGRPHDIEAVLANASSVWLAIACLQERRWVGDVDPALCPRLRRALAASRWRGATVLDRIVDQIEEGRSRAATPVVPPSARAPQPQAAPVVDYATTVRVLRSGGGLGIPAGQALALEQLDRRALQTLIALADPTNDHSTSIVRFIPAMAFTPNGHVVGQNSSTSTGTPSDVDRLRPAIAAANRFNLPMPWHEERLLWPWTDTYGASFIASLAAQGDGARFYEALEQNADVLVPLLGRPNGATEAEALLDERLAPLLRRCLLLGDDSFFEGLCNLALHVPSAAAVPLLNGLLDRWAEHFDARSFDLQGDAIALWRGFARLTSHPRFKEVPGWRQTLENVLPANIRWYHKDDIVRVLATDPGSYIVIENRLAREENWVHFNVSAIDTMDAAAERLFAGS